MINIWTWETICMHSGEPHFVANGMSNLMVGSTCDVYLTNVYPSKSISSRNESRNWAFNGRELNQDDESNKFRRVVRVQTWDLMCLIEWLSQRPWRKTKLCINNCYQWRTSEKILWYDETSHRFRQPPVIRAIITTTVSNNDMSFCDVITATNSRGHLDPSNGAETKPEKNLKNKKIKKLLDIHH